MPRRISTRLCAVALTVWASARCGREAPQAAVDGPTGITIHTVQSTTLRDTASGSGAVIPAAVTDWTIMSSEASQIEDLPKKEGDPVAIGDILVRFEIASVQQELAARQLEQTEAALRVDRAKSEVARLSGLVDRGIVARNVFEAAKSEQSSAEMSLGQTVALLETAKIQESRATVRARFPGVVLKVWHVAGDDVPPSEPVLRVIDPTRLHVSVQLPLAQLARIVPGQIATVRPIAAAADLAATVAYKAGANDPSAATGEVRLALNEPAALALDSPVSAEILLDQRTGALIVPVAALLKDGTGAYVMLAGTDLRAHRRDIGLGLVTRDYAQVTSGLAAGDHVIVAGAKDVTEGTPIAVGR